jgi:putative solute:sodium symporter small subunit
VATRTGGEGIGLDDCPDAAARRRLYWIRTLRLTAILLAIWFAVTYLVILFALPLNRVSVFGFPFAFYMGAQGALIVYVALVVFYARYMNRLDREFGVHEED